MKNLFETAIVDEINSRLNKLAPQDQPKWGRMCPAQAVAHCSLALEWAVGDSFPPRLFIGRLLGGFVKPKLVATEEPMRKHAPTAKSLIVKDDRNLEEERRRLSALIDRFNKGGAQKCTKHPHPFFGPMKDEEWAILMYKHLDHHLRQFGA